MLAASRSRTVGALVRDGVAGAPHAGVHWEHRGLRFEIVDMDGDRTDKVLVSVVSEERSGAD